MEKRFEVSFKIVNPQNDKKLMMHGVACIYDSACFAYGNGKGMYILLDRNPMPMNFDIRYDRGYSPDNEKDYISKVIHNNWDGTHGSWKALHVSVKEIDS